MFAHPAGGAWARGTSRGQCSRIFRIVVGSKMNATTRMVLRQRRGLTSNTLAINLAHSRRRSRCNGVGVSDALAPRRQSATGPALSCALRAW